MEEQSGEETPQAEQTMLEDEEEDEEEEEEEMEEEMTDAEIVEFEEGTDDEEQVDVAVNVELGDDTVAEADEIHTAGVDGTEEEVIEASPGEPSVPQLGSSTGLIIKEDNDDVDEPATAASVDHLDVLEPSSMPTISADSGEDTVALEDIPSQPDTVAPDVRVGRYTDADYTEEVGEVDERAEYADADQADVMKDEYEERPSVAISRPYDIPGSLLRCFISSDNRDRFNMNLNL